jgi:hypothetical protein
MRSIFKAIALVSGLLVAGCSTASGSETVSMSTEEMASGWGGSRARLGLGPGRILFSNGRLATGVGTSRGRHTADAKVPVGIIQTSSRMGERWIVCGVTARGGYFSNGAGTLVCSLVTPDGDMEPIVSVRGLQGYFHYDVSGTARLIAAGRDIIRFDAGGHIQGRWRLGVEGRFVQSLILSGDEVATISINQNEECHLVRHRLLIDGRAQEIDRQNVPKDACGEPMLARDTVSDALWLIMKGRNLAKVDPDAALLGLADSRELNIKEPRVFTVSAGLVVIEGMPINNNSRLLVYNEFNKELDTIDLTPRRIIGIAPDYRHPGVTTITTLGDSHEDYGYNASLFSNNGALVYAPPA